MRWKLIQQHLLALASIIVLTTALELAGARRHLTLANIVMFYLLLVVVMAVTGGMARALLTAVTSFVTINYFFVSPLYTLTVSDPTEVLDLIVFLVVATIAGRLAADARQRAYEQALLYRVTGTFNQLATQAAVIEALEQIVREDFHASRAAVLAGPRAGHSAAVKVPLRVGDEAYGLLEAQFRAALRASETQLLHACASQAAMALQRIDLGERARRSQQFEEADRLKTALLHAVSHDLRTPITIIKSSAANLRRLGTALPDAERADIAAAIEAEADHLDRLVGNLLDMSRLKAGALRLSTGLNSLEEIAGDVAARAWQLTKAERIALDFPAEMPLVSFDYGLVLQAVSNLVDNALRYEPPESKVVLRGRAVDKTASLRIINHGEDIPADEKALIMEPFYRGKGGHLGLGLPIARGIIEAHHGRMRVADTPGGGATFIIELPLQEGVSVEP